DVTTDAGQRLWIGAGEQPDGFRCLQALATRVGEQAGHGVPLPAAGFDAQQLLPGRGPDAVDEQTRALAALGGVGNRAGVGLDLELEAAVRYRRHAHGGQPDAERTLDLIDVLREHRARIVGREPRRVDDGREDDRLRLDALRPLSGAAAGCRPTT